ncbi:hypothetical protein COU79_04995, partial [Candidatus Peregrinibacteria bacterium CG10_big_fil_rev_8_21_14_0_10_54_7]
DLQRYQDQTGYTVAVCIVQTLDGMSVEDYAHDLFNTWKIGNAKTEQGVLLLIATVDRDVKIEPGGGLEHILTAGRSGEILDEYAVPFLHDNNWQGGVESTVRGMKQTLGTLSPAERAAMVEREAKESAESAAKARAFALHALFVFVLLLGGGIFLFVSVRVYNEKKRKAELRRENEKIKVELSGYRQDLLRRKEDIKEMPSTFPDWAKKNALVLLEQVDSILESTRSINSALAEDTDVAAQFLHGVQVALGKVADALETIKVHLPLEIKVYEEDAPVLVHSADKALKDARSAVEQLGKEGFHVEKFEPVLAAVSGSLQDLQVALTEKRPDFKSICEKARVHKDEISNCKTGAKALKETRDRVEHELHALDKKVSDTLANLEEHGRKFRHFKNNAPSVCWRELDNKHGKLQNHGHFRSSSEKAARLNHMEVQDFAAAADIVSAMYAEIITVKEWCQSIDSAVQAYDQAMRDYTSKLHDAETARSHANSQVNDSDAGGDARSLFNTASASLSTAESMASGRKVDWPTVVKHLDVAITKFGEAKSNAESDILRAEQRREDARRAEKRRQEAARRSSISSSSHHSGGGPSRGGGSYGGGASRKF